MTIKIGTPGVAANSTQLAQLRQDLSVAPKVEFFVTEYGALFDGTTDDTAAILATIQACFNAGGGTVVFPKGIGRVTSVVFDWGTSDNRINIRGQGATILQKLGGTTTPVLNLSAAVGTNGVYSTLEHFTIAGNAKTHHGIQATRIAHLQTHNLKIYGCDVAFESLGSLIMSHHDFTWNGNNIGYRSRVSTMYCNLVNFVGGTADGNTSFGFDIGDASGVGWYGVEMDGNGTSLNTATGAIVIRDTVDNETGYSAMSINGCWFEANLGSNLLVENATGLALSVCNTPIINSEAGRAMNVGTIQSLTLESVQAGSVGDTVTTAAVNSRLSGGVIHTIADTATNYRHVNVTTGAGVVNKGNSYTTVLGHIYDGDAYFKLGAKIRVIAGTNGRAGTATLVAGAVTVSTNQVGANTLVLITGRTDGGTPGWLRVSAVTNGVSFVITSSSGTDTGVVSWLLVDVT